MVRNQILCRLQHRPRVNLRVRFTANVTVTTNSNPQPSSFFCEAYLLDLNGNFYDLSPALFFETLPSGGGSFTFTKDVTHSFDEIPEGHKLNFVFRSNSLGDNDVNITFTTGQFDITATAIAINSVVETHRWTDLIDEVSNMPVDKPIFQSGFLYNTVLTNGYGIRSIRGKDFTTTPKAVYDFGFLNIDYQINSNNILIGTFEQFYPNKAIANIDELIAETSSKTVNPKFRITDVMIGFKKYEQDRDEQNTLDAVHTYSEWKTPNAFAQGKFERRTDIIFDVYKIESARRLGFEDRTRNTSLDSDDDLFGFEITPIGSDNVQVYTGLFSQLTSTGQIKLLTNSFSWYSIGIEAGDSITITGSNAGTYTVDSINDVGNVVTLLGTNAGQNLEEVITITYTLNGVLFKSRTDEGYTSITGVSNPDNFGNLSYHQKKLLQRFSSYLATTTKYQTDPIRLVDFKSNRNLVVDGVADATDFTSSGIIISPYLLNLQAKLPFDVARNLLTAMVTRNNDGTIGGYVTISGQSGWIKDMTYMFTPDECEVEMELELLDNQGTDVAYLLTEDGGYLLQENNGKIEL